MRLTFPLLLALCAWTTTIPNEVAGDESVSRPVDLALVLLTDVSNSMDNREYEMVKEGYKAAFADPQVVQAILDNSKGVAIAYVEFSGKDEFIVVKGWDVLTDAPSALAFGEAVAAAPRSSSGSTALAAGIKHAGEMLAASALDDARRVIDVVSDHPTDGGRSAGVRDEVVAAGMTINALPIIENHRISIFDGRPSYASAQWGVGRAVEFYRQNVIGGPGSFLLEAHDYSAFGEALKRKLLRELISSSSRTTRTLATN